MLRLVSVSGQPTGTLLFSACDTVGLCAKLELQILKAGRFSVDWFMLAARLVKLKFHWDQFSRNFPVANVTCTKANGHLSTGYTISSAS